MRNRIFAACTLALALAGCSASPENAPPSAAIATSSVTAPERGTPVVPGRRARVFVMAGFREQDCSPLAPVISITTPPAKGDITLEPNQTTSMQFSQSGKCTGKPMPGTGIYYTARAGTTGSDTFTITATSGTGQPMTKSFTVRIVE